MANTYKFKDAKLVDGRLYGLSMTTTREVSDGKRGEATTTTTEIKFEIDFNGIPLDLMMQYAGATLTIRRQNGVWKKMTPAQIKQDEYKVINWADMGKGGESTKAPNMIATLANIMIANGMPEAKAVERAADIAKDPAKLKTMLEMAGMLSE